ncbi:hypothetical protein ILUMI_03058 [Ignelater luminosus]|uniref:Uncharacterized protein n=1 Tax=Ignelater luminosus TaxID=2038154 RepID=A0A8K0DMK6_IGNLU|nr:hypothetical protein ILUMI_03058 [Ignelater luminosus]
MEQDRRGNAKLLYRTLKSIRLKKKCELQHIEDEKEILNVGTNSNGRPVRLETIPNIIECERQNITKDKLVQAIKELKNGNATGSDNIKADIIKYMGEIFQLLHKILYHAHI